MDNQHRKIVGYRELTQEEIDKMNDVKMIGQELGALVNHLRDMPNIDQRWVSIGATDLQTGLMALTRAIAKPTFFAVALLVLVGCSHGLQEKAFQNEHGVYVVSQSLVNDRVTSTQPHVSGTLACWGKYSSEEMAAFRSGGEDHTWFHTCQPIEQYKAGMYQATSDQPIATLYKGPIEAAIIGGSIGAGLALSGDTVTQQNTAAAGASASATGGKAIVKSGHRGRH